MTSIPNSHHSEVKMLFRAFLLSVLACALLAHLDDGGNAPHFQRLPSGDEHFCKGELELHYPDVVIRSCAMVPLEFREKLSRDWGPPLVRMEKADKKKKYTLMMLDPDAPSRSNPTRAFWRHWLIVDIKGSTLAAGGIKGTILSDYTRPTPPQRTGFHRYQILVYEQTQGRVPSLSERDGTSLGNWNPQAFVGKSGLVGPVASLQFLTQNYKD